MKQFIKFGLVGASNTVISYVLYCLLVLCGINYVIASIIGFVASVLNSYYWNSRYVFGKNGEKCSGMKVLCKTFVAYAGTGLVLSSVLLVLWVEIVCLSELIAPIVNLCITIPLNFIVNKYWAYRK